MNHNYGVLADIFENVIDVIRWPTLQRKRRPEYLRLRCLEKADRFFKCKKT